MNGASGDETVSEQVADAIGRLEGWILRHGWAGYDPLDIFGAGWYKRLAVSPSAPARAVHRAANGLARRFPLVARKTTGVAPRIHAEAVGLLAAAHCVLFESTGERSHLTTAAGCADWLLTNPSEGYPGLGWGYPFDWQAITWIPAGTPSAVATTVVGDGLWRLWRGTGERKYLDACVEVCRFLLEGLRRTDIGPGTFCFSFTPLDLNLVHSANLCAAEFIARVGGSLKRPDWLATAIHAGSYALREQNADGSIFCWGRAQNDYAPDHLDCYHSGLEIRSLWGLWLATGDPRFRESSQRYLDFFCRTYLQSDGAVRFFPGRAYPVDIHGCAEALLCPAALLEAAPARFRAELPKVVSWVLNRMQNQDGSFAYMIHEGGRVDRTSYVRWGQASMLRALAQVRLAERSVALGSAPTIEQGQSQ